MGKRMAFLVLALAFCLSPMARAANIIWVSESIDVNGDGTPDDAAWIPWLQGLGYTVDVQRGNWTALDNAKIATLNAADLVIISRCTSSGNYNNDATEISQWSGIKAPILNLSAYFARNSRWFWVNSGATTQLVGPLMEVVVPDHPIFSGIKLNAAKQVAVVDGTTGSGQTSLIASVDAGNGTLLAKSGANGWIMEWQPGKPFYTGSSETPAGKRLLFCAGTQEVSPTPIGAFNLTDDGKKMLSNAILYLLGKTIVEGQATNPVPEKDATDVPTDIVLRWTAGEFAQTHDVYVGLSAEDVGSASRTAPLGMLASQDQSDAAFAPVGLQFGQTYYWRVDEVNAVASTPIAKGEIWSFTVEPQSYPIQNVTATASSARAGSGPENTVNGSGLDTNDQHSVNLTDMWVSLNTQPIWIQYEFDKVYQLSELWVWNSNQSIESFAGFGAKEVAIEYSTDGSTWTPLQGVPEVAQAPGVPTYTHDTTVNFGGVSAKYVKLTILSNWGGLPMSSLAEVRFLYVPLQARGPQPASGATEVDLDTTLNWRPGREATSHTVRFGTDKDAVANGTAPAQTVTGHSDQAGTLLYGTTYYWKVDEVGAAGTWPGETWSFTTREFAAADDFESYNDVDNLIFDAWLDGVTTKDNGSTVGHWDAPFAEQQIVHGGHQSMPMEYNNVRTPYYSEAEREFTPPQNWTLNGATHVGLWFRGNPAVSAVAVTEAGGKISLTGAGTDIWNTSDEFTFAYRTLNGDGSIVARVVNTGTGSNTWAKGGVMIRASVNGGSAFANTVISGGAGNGASFQYRLAANGACGNTDAAAVVASPYWVKLERKGDSITGYFSADGKSWSMLGTSQTIPMSAPVLIGLCVTSHAAGEQRTFQFEGIATTGNVTGAWQGAAIASPQYNDPAGLYLMLVDDTGKRKLVTHPDPAAAATGEWTLWTIPLSEFTGAGVKMTRVATVIIGVGDRNNPKPGGVGMLYVDDLGFGHPVSEK